MYHLIISCLFLLVVAYVLSILYVLDKKKKNEPEYTFYFYMLIYVSHIVTKAIVQILS